jgi:hypothetical protein
LTTSPKDLGTALFIEASISFNERIDTKIDQDLVDEIEHGKKIKLTNRLASGERDI